MLLGEGRAKVRSSKGHDGKREKGKQSHAGLGRTRQGVCGGSGGTLIAGGGTGEVSHDH